MKNIAVALLGIIMFSCQNKQEGQSSNSQLKSGSLYTQNRAPLRPNPYIELPLGTIKPKGDVVNSKKRIHC